MNDSLEKQLAVGIWLKLWQQSQHFTFVILDLSFVNEEAAYLQ
jgi:hypothetical protein